MNNKIIRIIIVCIFIIILCVAIYVIKHSLPSKETTVSSISDRDNESVEPEILDFVDALGEHHQTEILNEVPKHEYDLDSFRHEGDRLYYDEDTFTSRLGLDVSHHQGYINWEKVKNAGYDFAILRIGYRGYGQTGSINLDKLFDENIKNAHDAGIDVGVYFFSQAINEQEAKEEAEFVIEHLKGYELELPVVYDPESILNDEARTDNVSGEQFTKNTILFCKMISDAGYEPMIYSNMLWEAFKFDMEKVCQYPFWYADYEKLPQTPYDFMYWQYTDVGNVDGVQGIVDIDIELKKAN